MMRGIWRGSGRYTFHGLSSEELVDRAARKAESWRYIRRWFAIAVFVVLVGITEPVHAWLHAHLQFLYGVVVGSLLQVPGWLRDRWCLSKHDLIEEHAEKPNPL